MVFGQQTPQTYKGVFAGFLIGLGVIMNTIMTPPILGAALFSFGLLAIIYLELPLLTGKVGFMILNSKQNWRTMGNILFSNCIGIIVCIVAYSFLNPNFLSAFVTIAAIKTAKSIPQCFIGGLFCGSLIHIAVKYKEKKENPLIVILCIITFISIGAEHCIADFPYFVFAPELSLTLILKFVIIIIGNGIGAILTERITT